MRAYDVNIRVSTESDIPALVKLLNQCFKRVLALLVGKNLPGKFVGEIMQNRFFGKSTTTIVAEDSNSDIVGMIFFRGFGTRILAGPLSVAPNYQMGDVVYQMRDYFIKNTKLNINKNTLDFCTFSHSPVHLSQYWHFCNTQKLRGGPTFQFPLFAKSISVGESIKTFHHGNYIWLRDVERHARQNYIDGMKSLSNKLFMGLDFSNEAHHVLDKLIGNVLIILHKGKVLAFAICHFGQGAESLFDDFLAIKYLFVDNELENPGNVFCNLMVEIENYAAANKLRSVSLLVNSQWVNTVNSLLAMNYETVFIEQGYTSFLDASLVPDDIDPVNTSFYAPHHFAAYELR
jgi:hypothetical protein